MTAASAPAINVQRAILPSSGGLRGVLSDAFWRKPTLLLLTFVLLVQTLPPHACWTRGSIAACSNSTQRLISRNSTEIVRMMPTTIG